MKPSGYLALVVNNGPIKAVQIYVAKSSTSLEGHTLITPRAASLTEFEAYVGALRADLDMALVKAKLAFAEPKVPLAL
jgi:hypothetical protein